MSVNDNKALFFQLADQIMDQIMDKQFTPGSRLPSVREFAANCGVNPNTVMRTYSFLQQEEIIYNQRGIGYFCSETAPEIIRNRREKQFFDSEIKQLFRRLQELSISPEKIKSLYQDYLSN